MNNFAVSALTLYYPISDTLAVLGIVSVLAGALAVFFSKRSQNNQTASNELIQTLTRQRTADKEDFDRALAKTNERIVELERMRKEDGESIAHLKGQLDTYKNLPLKDWAESMKTVALTNKATSDALKSIDYSNSKILQTLQKSALIAAHDKTDLIPTYKTTTEVVTK